MAKEAFIFCPHCERVGQMTSGLFTEMPEQHIFRCLNGHAFEYLQLMAMNPRMKKLEVVETAQPNQVKAEFWIDQNILSQFRAKLPNQQSATVESILSLYLYGDPVIIDGNQAKAMRELGVRSGQEALVAIQMAKTLEAELATAQEKVAMLQGLFRGAGVDVPV